MKLLHYSPSLSDRLVWQCASLLLAYPDARRADRLHTVDELLAHLSGPPAELLARAAAALRTLDPMHAAVDYVDTFDLRRRCTIYLTYWTAGDTRDRGSHMLAFARAYREAGMQPPRRMRRPTILRWCSSSPPPSTRRPVVGCWKSIGWPSMCCTRR